MILCMFAVELCSFLQKYASWYILTIGENVWKTSQEEKSALLILQLFIMQDLFNRPLKTSYLSDNYK